MLLFWETNYSCAFNYCSIAYNRDTDSLELGDYFSRGDGAVDPCSLVDIPYLDTDKNLWHIFPKLCVNEAAWQKQKQGNLDYVTMMDGLRTIYPTMLAMCVDPDEFLEGNTSSQFYTTPNRYAYQDPFVVEFGSVQSISHFYIHQTHSGSSYDNTFLDLDVYNEETQDWDRVQRVSYAGGNAKTLVALDAPIEAKTIRLVPGDTGRYGWILKHFTFYSSQEPVGYSATKSVRWCLVLPYWAGAYNRYSGNDFDLGYVNTSYGKNPGCPALALTVGDSHAFGTFYVDNATDLSGRQKVNPVSLQISLE